MNTVAEMIGALREVCAGLPDQRKDPRRDGDYSMADIGLAAFSIFFMGSPSFLGHQRALAEGHGRSNCETLFGMAAIPSDNYIRLMLDGASSATFDRLFFKAIEAAGPLTQFQCLDGRVPSPNLMPDCRPPDRPMVATHLQEPPVVGPLRPTKIVSTAVFMLS